MMYVRVVSGLAAGLTLAAWILGTAAAAAAAPHPAAPVAEVTPESAHSPEGTAATANGVEHGGAHGGGNTNPLEFKTDLALWTAVVFLVVLAVLWRFAWGPISEGLQRREKGIADQIAEAQESNRQAHELLAQYQQQLVEAKDEVRGILDRGRRDTEQVGREMIEKARAEAQAERQRAVRQIEVATAGALKELAERGADLAVELAGKIVQAELKPADHAALIRRTVASFSASRPTSSEN